MKFMIELAVIFYKYTILLIGCFLVLFALNLIPFPDVVDTLTQLYNDEQWRTMTGTVGVVILFFNFIFLKIIYGRYKKGKTIAFDNPAGRVTLSLAALEDLIQRLLKAEDEVKDVRSTITAGRKGLTVDAKIALGIDVNIPETTSRLQEMIRKKIHNTVGLEETVIVRVHVVKITPEETKSKRPKDKDKEEGDSHFQEPPIPFQGYRA